MNPQILVDRMIEYQCPNAARQVLGVVRLATHHHSRMIRNSPRNRKDNKPYQRVNVPPEILEQLDTLGSFISE